MNNFPNLAYFLRGYLSEDLAFAHADAWGAVEDFAREEITVADTVTEIRALLALDLSETDLKRVLFRMGGNYLVERTGTTYRAWFAEVADRMEEVFARCGWPEGFEWVGDRQAITEGHPAGATPPPEADRLATLITAIHESDRIDELSLFSVPVARGAESLARTLEYKQRVPASVVVARHDGAEVLGGWPVFEHRVQFRRGALQNAAGYMQGTLAQVGPPEAYFSWWGAVGSFSADQFMTGDAVERTFSILDRHGLATAIDDAVLTSAWWRERLTWARSVLLLDIAKAGPSGRLSGDA